jgi:hypothetical protein
VAAKAARQRYALALALLSAAPAVLAPEWIDPRSLETSSHIVEKTGKRLLSASASQPAGGALFFVQAGYKETAALLKQLVESRFPVGSGEEHAHSNFLQLAESMSFGLDRPTLRDLWIAGWKSETEKLVRAEVLRNDFKETRIRSGRYNVFPSRDGYSFLTVHALDASDLFGKAGTVIVLYRFDTAKEWWMSNPHDPFSFGYRQRVERVVSEDEFALIPVLAEKLGTPYRVFALGSNPVTSYEAQWREGRTWLEARR